MLNKPKKTDDISQKLLNGEQEECERKISADHVPLAPLARPGRQQRERNKAYINRLQAALSHLPESIKQLIVDYARPEWCLDRNFKLHDERIYDLSISGNNTEFPGFSYAIGTKKHEIAVWETDTGIIRKTGSAVGRYKILPRQLSGFSSWLNSGLTDFACSPDGQKMAATSFDKSNLYIWPSELSLANAVASKKMLNIRNKDMTPAESNVPAVKNPFTAVTFSSCSNYVFVGAIDGTMHQLDATTAEPIYSFEHPAAVTALATSGDGNSIYAGLEDGSLSVWQGELLPPSEEPVALSIAVAPDAPQPALMDDDPVKVVENRKHQRVIADWYCLEDCTNCYKHSKKSCSLCAQACKASAACCYSGASCAIHCPRSCVCGCGYAVCVKKCCLPILRRLCAPFKRLWQ